MGIPVSVKKILLVNGWSDLNKGDSGIVYGMINSFKKTLPDVEISLLSGFSENDYRFINGYGHLLTSYPWLRVYGSLLPYRPIWHAKVAKPIASKPIRICFRVGYLIRSLIILASLGLGKLLLSKNERKTLRNFQGTDLIISKGGHIFHSMGGLKSFIGLYHHAYPLLLATKLGKPFAFYAQSMGPFKGRIARRFARWLFSKASLITVREELSRDTLISLKVPIEKIKVVPDAAFALDFPSNNEIVHVLKDIGIGEGEKFVAITVRQWFFAKTRNARLQYRQYLHVMAQLVDHIIECYGMKVVFMPQVLGPTKAENDLIAIHQVYDLISNKSGVCILEEDFSPPQLLSIYQKAHVFIGTRFHSVIFALLMGIPALAISYFGPKSKGIMKMIGLEDFVLDISNVSFEQASQKLDRLIKGRDAVAALIEERVKELHQGADKVPSIILQAVEEEKRK